jgi:hypothetical protein
VARIPTSPASIQGEQQAARGQAMFASDAAVDDWTAHAPAEVIVCRERGRHLYAPTRGISFSAITPEGWYVRRVPCEACRIRTEDDEPWPAPATGMPRVVRVELWDVKHHRDKITRCSLVKAQPEYLDQAYLGAPGHGRMKPRQIRASSATAELAGQSVTTLRKVIKEAERTAEIERRNRLAALEVAQLSIVSDAG